MHLSLMTTLPSYLSVPLPLYQNENFPPFSSLFPFSDHKDLLYLVTIAVGRFPELSLSLFYGTSEMERNIPASQRIFIAAHST